ncbi:MAG: hypothetical protein ABWY25_10305 [Paenisporosarcina sp.]
MAEPDNPKLKAAMDWLMSHSPKQQLLFARTAYQLSMAAECSYGEAIVRVHEFVMEFVKAENDLPINE